MPAVSLVVCLYREKELLVRLLESARDCCDDLVVVHDGPDDSGVKAVVEKAGGRFFEHPRAFQQEPHWPFAWGEARYDWILRLDADEVPSDAMKGWLKTFRAGPEPGEGVSGYTCIWPLWNGRKAVTHGWPDGRIFLFHRQRVRFFGMVEAVPIPDGKYEPADIVLHHQPVRRSYGIRNILFRRQAYHWRRVISKSLSSSPTALYCWRWNSPEWPPEWESLRKKPIHTALFRLVWFPLYSLKAMLRAGQWPRPAACLNPGLHHFMLGLRVWRDQRRRGKPPG